MDIDYSILDEFNIDKEKALKHLNNSTQIKKYIESLCDLTKLKSIRKRQSTAFKELLLNIDGWKCNTCDLQFYNKKSYSSHITGIEHRVKVNGGKILQCSSAKCRKKFASQDELEQHFLDSRPCVSVSPKNKAREDYKKLMTRIKREKELYNLVNYTPEDLTQKDIEEYNSNIIKEYSNHTDYTINKTNTIFKAVFSKKEQRQQITKEDEEWIKREKEIQEEDRVLAEKIEKSRLELMQKAKIAQDARDIKMHERDFYGTDEKSNLLSDKFLTGLTSSEDDEEEENIKVL